MPEKEIPIIFCHTGAPAYLKDTIEIAEKYNNTVVLIGNEENNKFCFDWVDIQSVESVERTQFADCYINFSPNTKQYELFCFERYFYVLNLMKKRGYQEIVFLDSDVCLFYNISNFKFDGYDVALNANCDDIYMYQSNCAYWTYSALKDFTEYLSYIYTYEIDMLDEYSFFTMEYAWGQGISDMVLLKMWVDSEHVNCLLFDKLYNGMVIDYNVNCKEVIYDYDDLLGKKKIKFRNRIPYFFINGRPVRAVCIHCQGTAKEMIYNLKKRRSGRVYAALVRLGRKLRIIPFCR